MNRAVRTEESVYRIEAPGKVLFREMVDGEVTVEHVRSPSEMRGFAAQSEASTDKPATEILREKREQDRKECGTQFSTGNDFGS